MEDKKPLTEKIKASGHINVTARHRTTFEITKEDHLTPQGDCIIAVCADRGFPELSQEFKEKLKDEKTRLEIKISCCGLEEKITAYGHPGLTFENSREMVVRKSDYVCGRTLAIRANKASCDFDRRFVNKLAEGNPVTVELKING